MLSSIISSCFDRSKEASINPKLQSEWIRYDQELIKAINIPGHIDSLRTKYGAFSKLYEGEIMGFRSGEEMPILLRDSSFVLLMEDTEKYLKLTEGDMRMVDQAVENLNNLFGESPANLRIYSFVSGFVYQCFLFEDEKGEALGLGLDFFLGDSFPYKEVGGSSPIFSSYLTRTYNVDHLAKKVIEVMVEDRIPPPPKEDFINLMLWGGKKLYLIDQILDFQADTIILEYSKAQLDWCKKNEAGIWNHFFDQDLFYETNLRRFNKLIAPAPNSPGMPTEAPGATGNYMGWRIVTTFMDRYPDTSIGELLSMDAQQLLERSKYKPSL